MPSLLDRTNFVDTDPVADDAVRRRALQDSILRERQQSTADAAAAAQRAAQADQVKQDTQTASGDLVQWHSAGSPVAGKQWTELDPDSQQGLIHAYPRIAGKIPGLFNEIGASTTGHIPGLSPGSSVTVSPEGMTRRFEAPPEKPPREQVVTNPADQHQYVADLSTGQAKPINYGNATGAPESTPEEDAIVEKMANYEVPGPFQRGGFNTQQRNRLQGLLATRYPQYDAKEYQSRQAALTGFKEGPEAKAITSANTVVGHLNSLNDSIDALNNYTTLPGITNPVANYVGGKVSADTQQHLVDFDSKANAVAGELSKLFTGNAPTQQTIKEWRSTLDPNMSPQALKQSVASAVTLIGSRMEALQDQWDKGVKGPRNVPFLTPKSRAILRTMGRDPDELDPIGNPPAQQGATTPAQSTSAQPKNAPPVANAIPQPGEVRDGYRFKGGAPHEKANWEKVQ